MINIAAAPDWVLGAPRPERGQRDREASTGTKWSQSDPERVRSALPFIDADEYETWLHVGMALHEASGGSDEGFDLWDEWSQRSDKYDSDAVTEKWDSFSPGGGITLGTLFELAKQAGWVPLHRNASHAGAGAGTGDDPPPDQGASLILDPGDPFPGADRFIRDHFTNDGVRCLHHQRGLFYAYTGADYAELEESTLRARLWTHAQAASQRVEKEGKPSLVPFRPTTNKINNLFDAARAIAHLSAEHQAPCWLVPRAGDPPPEELVSLQNGLLHVPSRQLDPASPRFYTHNALGFRYAPGSEHEPLNWLRFLKELWPSDTESIRTLQEMFGYLLLTDTRQQKIFLIVGPPRSGKGTIARILVALLGQRNVAAPTLEALSTNFGLQPLIGKMLALISDARLGARNDQAAIAERLLSISGEDSVTIDRKHQESWTGRLSTRFLIMTNELPQLADASSALAKRFVVLSLTQSFYGREDPLLTSRILPEIPAIFAWALDGWERLTERGHFVQPEGGDELVRELEELGSPVSAFIRERCTVEPSRTVEVKRLYEAWKHWCESEGREHPGNAQTLGRKLRAAVPGLRSSQPRDGDGRLRFYEGIGLNGAWGG